jgi:hypothetical protein
MSIASYSALSTEIQDWLHRSDLSGKISTAVQLLEDEFNRKLRCRQMLQTVTISFSSNSAPLPADYLEMRNVQLQSGTNPPLVYVSPEQLDGYDRGLYTGQPRIYTISGGNIVIAPIPDQTYPVAVTYFQKIPSLEVNSTNWLLTSYPLAYLWGGIMFLRAYVTDQQLLADAKAGYDEIVNDINRADDNSTYSGSVIRVRADVVR